MADDLINKCSILAITEHEEEFIPLGDVIGEDVNSIMEMAVVGKILTKRPYSFEAFKIRIKYGQYPKKLCLDR